jgi:hypothetical protein
VARQKANRARRGKENAMNRGWLVSMVVAVGFVAPAVVAPRDASACLSAIAIEEREHAPTTPEERAIQLVAKGEQDLSEGKQAKAAEKALAAFPVLQPKQAKAADRALRVLALAVTRSGGAVDPGNLRSSPAKDAAQNLAWAAETMRNLNARHANNPSYRSDLGEALARVPGGRGEALEILGQLADKDLLTTAEAYAALARLRAEGGEKEARDAAVARCATMTKSPATVCAAPAVSQS